jgi:hypothetical protein
MNDLARKSAFAKASSALRSFAVLIPLFIFFTTTSLAQNADEASGSSPNSVHSLKLGSLRISGELRGRGQIWNWFLGNTRTHYTFGQSMLQVAIAQQRSKFGWKIAIEQPALYALPSNAFHPVTHAPMGLGAIYYSANDNQRNPAGFFISQAYLSIHGIDRNHSTLKIGRFEFNEGEEKPPASDDLAWIQAHRVAQRLAGTSDWTGITRSFDGAHFSTDIGAKTNVTGVAGRVTQGVFHVNGIGEMNVDVLYGAYTRELPTRNTDSELRVFGLEYHDGRDVLKADNRALSLREADHGDIRIGTVGLNYALVVPIRYVGKWDLLVWGAQQFGHWGTMSHRANSGLFELGWRPPIPWIRPWLRAGAFFASGDGNPDDLKHTTFFQPLPTQQQYARLPFYTLQNSEDYLGQLILQPTHRLELRSEIHKVKLHSVNDSWYLGSGAFQNSSFGYDVLPDNGHRGLGNYVDFSADCQVTQHFGFSYYIGAMSGKGAETTNLKGKKGGFSYLELRYRF